MVFHEIGDFRDGARLWHSCRVVQSAGKYFFIRKTYFFLRKKNTSHIVCDIVAGVGALQSHSKPSNFMIFGLLQKKTQVFL